MSAATRRERTSAPFAQAAAPNTWFDRAHDRDAVKILPGEYWATGEDIVLVTVLGSCVAACIRDPHLGIGGMNHFMLPDSACHGDVPVSASARYGNHAMEMLINELVKRGARREGLEAKVFGGGNVLPGLTVANVGPRNADFVLKYLATEGIPVLAQDLVETCARKVCYFPRTGRVRVKRLREANHTIVERERDYRTQIDGSEIRGDVELFS